MRRLAPLLALLLTVLVTSGCEEPPNREMHQAQGAIDAARAAGAETFAPTELEAATTALNRARAAVEQSDYRQALSQALEARDQARTAARRAAEEQARVRSEVDARVRDVDATIDTLARRLQAPDAARLPRTALAGAEQKLERARRQLTEVRAAVAEGRLVEARDAVLAIGPLLESTLSEIDAAVAAQPPRRPGRRTPPRGRR
ncbi:MAG: DUF4398 domain-containing protein [Vicinamibacteraceae bacterium]|nr:DUF4398 domain-containing protein [Vicinamibacteraceae bacterium]